MKIPPTIFSENNKKMRPHLHRYLRLRLGIYLVIAIVVGVFVIFNSVRNSIPGVFAIVGVLFGIVIGALFSRIHKISWDEKASKVIARMDVFGIVIMILYTLFEIFREKIVGKFVGQADVTVTSFSVLTGIMYGRVIGIRGNIKNVLNKKDLI